MTFVDGVYVGSTNHTLNPTWAPPGWPFDESAVYPSTAPTPGWIQQAAVNPIGEHHD